MNQAELASFYTQIMEQYPKAIVGLFCQALISVSDRYERPQENPVTSLGKLLPALPESAISPFLLAVQALDRYYTNQSPDTSSDAWLEAVAVNRELISKLPNMETYLDLCNQMMSTPGWLHIARGAVIAAGGPFLLQVDPTIPAMSEALVDPATN